MASLVGFDVLEFSLNFLFTLIIFDKKGNALPMQTRVIFFWPGKNTNYIIANNFLEMICFLDRLQLLVCFDSGP